LTRCVVCSAPVDADTGRLWRKDGFDIVRCASCGLIFRLDPPEEVALGDIYDERYFRDDPTALDRHGYADYLADAPSHRANARRRLSLLASYLPQPGRLIDVGCAAGFFVDEARLAGWDASGVDVSESMVAFARSKLGVSARTATFTQADVPGPLDVVTMWDYIEHSVDPCADLAKAAALLRPGGVIAISTGDIGAPTARAAGRRWHLLTPEHHNFFFDQRTLRRLLEQTGFEVAEIRHRSAVYSVGHMLYKLAAMTSIRRLRNGATRLGGTFVPLNLFDIMTVVARRAI
jgi:2-polyprenyl-3-methyl-5-hydroxy-6-metoxy-1,4-benzoquinol methylase